MKRTSVRELMGHKARPVTAIPGADMIALELEQLAEAHDAGKLKDWWVTCVLIAVNDSLSVPDLELRWKYYREALAEWHAGECGDATVDKALGDLIGGE
jgi:hypothetical protein